MDEPSYHGEMRTAATDRRQTLSVDILLKPYKDGFGNVVSLSVWNPDDYDPSATVDLSAADARKLAEHLQRAATVLVAGSPCAMYPVPT